MALSPVLPGGRPPGTVRVDPEIVEAFGTAVRERRVALGISQEALAAMAGLSRTHVSRIERGEHAPYLTQIFRLAEVLGCRPGELVDATQNALKPRKKPPTK